MEHQLTLTAGADRACVDVAHGGRLAALVAGGADRLLSAEQSPAPERVGWGCFLMVPWPGRLAAAAVPWDGAEHPVPVTWGRHAIHGVGLDAAWQVTERSERHVRLACDLADGGWPLGGVVEQQVELAPGRLTCTAVVTAGTQAMPAALGWHPWFRRPDAGDLVVEVDADAVLVTDDELLPDGRTLPVTGALDLRGGVALGDRRLDHAYVAVREPARVVWPDLELTLDTDLPAPCYVVHTPPFGACVEPQSAWPNALRLDDPRAAGVRWLAPRTALTAACTWRWSPRT